MFLGDRCSVRKRPKQQDTDNCWSFLICFCATFSQALIMGIALGTFGVFLPVLMEQFNSGRGQTAWIGSLAAGLSFFAAPAAGNLSDRFGCRLITIFGSLICALGLFVTSFAKSVIHMFLSYGVLFGLGAACVRTCTFLEVIKHFYRWRSLATGLVSSGTGLGIFIYGPIVQELLHVTGLRNTYRVLTGFALFVCVLAVSFSSKFEEVEGQRDKCIDKHVHNDQEAYSEENQKLCFLRRKIFDCSPWKTPTFTIVTIAYATLTLGDFVPVYHLVKHCKELGIAGDSAAKLIMFFGIASFSARFIFAGLGDCKRVNSLNLVQGATLIIAVSILLLPLARTYTAFVVFSIVDGFFDGVMASHVNLLLLTTVSTQLRATAFGYANCLVSLSMTIGPSVAGFVADKLNSYSPAFYLAGSEVLLGSCITFLLCFLQMDPKQRTEITDQQNLTSQTLSPQMKYKRSEQQRDEVKTAAPSIVVELLEECRPITNACVKERTLEVRCTRV